MAKFRLLIDVEIESDQTPVVILHSAKNVVEGEFKVDKFLTIEAEELDYKDIDITKI